jgi:BRCT domain type II-containing protein
LERTDVEELIKRYGGSVKPNLSKKVNFVIVGDEPGVQNKLIQPIGIQNEKGKRIEHQTNL